ncbi:hypothetical protein AQUCO_08500007v1 [Aquilegia coerulea]|uniref:Uncharacterized protein n=1 Tax=Aquilegia coerulea TaxID=218851 RepID=A0A2G5C6L6_AQUCA|nr:hypothetical protein AQUCO_08500007v1 [Aquilegia coerulea]
MEEERRSQTLESEVAEQTCNKDALISSRNEPEVSGQLLDGGNEGDVGPEVSGLLDVGNEGFVGPEVSGLLLDDKVQNMESDNLSIPDLPTLEGRPHTSGKRDCHRLSREVNALKKSGVSKVLDTCTTRRYTRTMEREKASLEPVSETESSLDQASTAKIIRQEPRTRKRKQVENISNPDAPTLSTSRSKVPRVFREVEAIKKSKGASLTPDINLCTTGPRTRSMESKKASLEMLAEMTESRTRKRKEVEEHDAPRSSTSGSKAPKAKNTSPHNT